MTSRIISYRNPVIRRTDLTIFNSLISSDIYNGLDFIQVYTNTSRAKMFLDKDLCSPLYYDGHKVEYLNLKVYNEENCGLEDTISLGYYMDNGTFRGITNIDKSLLTYQPQIESDYPDLVAVDTKNLKKDLWNPDPNYLYDFVCAYREVKAPWRTDLKKFLCYTTYEKATKVLITNAVNQNSLIQKKKINLI